MPTLRAQIRPDLLWGREGNWLRLALRGAVERRSLVLMTALATQLAPVPLVITGNITGHETEYPMQS